MAGPMLRQTSIRRPFPAWSLGAVIVAAFFGAGSARSESVHQDPARALQILVVPTGSEAAWLRSQLQAGASFRALARERSVDPSSERGGYLHVDPRALRIEFQTALAGLEVGEVSEVARAGDQFVLLKWLTPDEQLWASAMDAGESAVEAGEWAGAVEAFAVAVQAAETPGFPLSDLSESLRGLGEANRALARYPEAESAYQRMLSVRWGGSRATDPNLLRSLDRFAEVLRLADLRDMDFGTALEDYLQRMSSLEPRPQLSLAMAEELIAARLPDAAETVTLEAVNHSPDSRELRYELAELYAESMQFGKALEAFEQASLIEEPGLDPETDRNQRAVIHERMGQIYTGLNRYDEAAAAFRAALEIEPDRLDSRLGLARLDEDGGWLQAAASDYESIVADRPGSVRAYHGLARANLQLNRLPASIAAANRALAIDSSYQSSRYVLGRALTRAGRGQEGRQALAQYQQALADRQARENEIRVIGTLNREGVSLLLEGRVEEAIRLLRSGIMTYPNADVLRLSLGLALRRSGQHDAAIGIFEEMVEMGIGDQRLVNQNLAALYDLTGDTEASLRHRVIYLAEYDASLAEALN